MNAAFQSPTQHAIFATTQWSVVVDAGCTDSPNASRAMASLCQTYWYPLYAYVRRKGYNAADAQDLTQEFFARLLEKRWLDSADREKGRLRTFLIVALKNFLNKEWRRGSAQKRGGNRVQVPFDTRLAETLYAATDSTKVNPEHAFDREWALKLLELALDRLEAEHTTAGKSKDFGALKDCLTAERGTIDYEALAARLNTSEGATRVAVHRLRKRFREIYREEIAQTLATDADAQEEMRHLAAALAVPG